MASGRTYSRPRLRSAPPHAVRSRDHRFEPEAHRIFLIAIRAPGRPKELLEAAHEDDAAEAELLRRFVLVVQTADPDVLENHNLHGFDLPFLAARARRLGVSLGIGRLRGLLGAVASDATGPDARGSAGPRVHRHAPCGPALRLAIRELPEPAAVARYFGLSTARIASADPGRSHPRDLSR
ncbi:MAG: 3'-5' exonuclease [Candidatus Eisenbacteria bacterium]